MTLSRAISGITSDSRQVKIGMLFAALPGTKLDGRHYIQEAIKNGASVILAPVGTIKPEVDVEWIESENPRRDFALTAAAYYKNQPEYIAAVTGTNGKTSTVTYVQQFWQALGFRAVSIGTVGISGTITREGAMTTPDPVTLYQTLADLSDQKITHVAMEASSHGLDQYRLDGTKIKAAAFTNLTRDHLDYHVTMDAYFKAKSRLFFDLLSPEGAAVIHLDDQYGQKLKAILDDQGIRVLTTGIKGEDIQLMARTSVPDGQYVMLKVFGKKYDLHFPVVGSVQIYNVLLALGIVLSDLTLTAGQRDQVISFVEKLRAPPGRVQYISGHPDGVGIYVDYAHTPDALEHLLLDLRPHTQGRLICVFGCGGDRDPGKRPQMGAISHKYADVTIITDDNPRSEDPQIIRQAILQECPNAFESTSRSEAITKAVVMARRGDVVVIAGKGHEQGQTIQGVTYPFDDVQEAQRAINNLKENPA